MAGFSHPITAHAGRYLDSTSVRELQSPVRTLRANRVKVAPERDRIFMQIGSTFVSYRLSTFFTQDLKGGMTQLPYGNRGSLGAEMYLPFYGEVYPEAQGSGWVTYVSDGQDRLGGVFDWDDRGYIYLAYTMFGWGIVQDTGGMMPLVKQIPVNETQVESPSGVTIIKLGGSYYAIVGGLSSRAAVYDVTTPATPQLKRYFEMDWSAMGRASVGGQDVFVFADRLSGDLKIYTAAQIVNGGGPSAVVPSVVGSIYSFDTEGDTIYAVEKGPGATGNIIVAFPAAGSAASYTAVVYPAPTGFGPLGVSYGDGALGVVGQRINPATGQIDGYEGKYFKLIADVPQEVPMGQFLKQFYGGERDASGQQKFSVPGYSSLPSAMVPANSDGRDFFVYAAYGLGDVYEVKAGDSIDIRVNVGAGYGTPNDHSTTKGTGPYYGDPISFTTSASSGARQVEINFDNTESTTGIIPSHTTPNGVTYRYSGIVSGSGVLGNLSRTVRMRTVDGAAPADSQTAVQMKTPAVRVMLKSSGDLLSGDASLGAGRVVVGDLFVDASDGSVESHFTSWALDGGTAEHKLPSGEFEAGACSETNRQLVMTANYGAYDFNGGSPLRRNVSDYSRPLSLTYPVAPFAAGVAVQSNDATGITFAASNRIGSTLAGSTAATFEWALLDASGQPIAGSEQLRSNVGVSTADSYILTGTQIAAAKKVRLTVTVPEAAVTGIGCGAAQRISIAELSLDVPTPNFVKTGCTNAGGACSITDTASQAGWTYSWSFNGSLRSETGKTFTPTTADLANPGTYQVVAIAKSAAGVPSAPVTIDFTLATAVCSTAPGIYSITKNWVNSSCTTANCEIQFNPSFWGYAPQSCDIYEWNFGDNNTSSSQAPTHRYAQNGTFTATLTIRNSAGAGATATTTVQVGSVVTPTCTAPSTSAGLSYDCPGGACFSGSAIGFRAVNYPSSSFQECDRFSWDFGDGYSGDTRQNPSHVYGAPGTYPVRLTISNTAGSYTTPPVGVTVVTGSASCAAVSGSVFIRYTGKTSGCSQSSTSIAPCIANEDIEIEAYRWPSGTFQECDKFQWSFGDGATRETEEPKVIHRYNPTTTLEFQIGVRVTNSSGTSVDGFSIPIKFGGTAAKAPTKVSFTTSVTTPLVGVPITFKGVDESVGTDPVTSWQWTFGEGDTRSGQEVTYTFSTAGKWTVELKASNSGGAAPPVSIELNVVPANSFAFMLPVVVHQPGYESLWRTDLQIYNGNAGNGPVELEFELTSLGIKKNMTLSVSTLIYEDFMTFFTSANASGAVIVRGVAPETPRIWTRTYNVSASGVGTFGQLIPAVQLDLNQNVSAGPSTYFLGGLQLTPRFRTNIGLLNLSAQPVEVLLTAKDDHFGATIGEQLTVSLPSMQLITNSDPQIAAWMAGLPKDAPFSLFIGGANDGALVTYASIIDNVSGDPIYVSGISSQTVSDEAWRSQVVPGVGHFNAWRSDVTILNPDEERVLQFDLTFYDQSGNKVTEAKDQILPPRTLLKIDDIVTSPKMAPPVSGNVFGMLRVEVDSPIIDRFPIVVNRTYSDGGPLGTFGQGIPSFAASRANVSPAYPAIVPAVRSDQLYYTNLGLVNVGTTPARVLVTLLDKDSGQPIGFWERTKDGEPHPLAPNESFNAFDVIRAMHSTADRGSLKVEVTSGGSVWAFASVIDRKTFDPEYVPAVPMN
ncbi:MAG TPA: PKD domain-containing protein [Thermoanaerobaculia bacterium]|nr:PKD domain-containing protein [Thermoanaerobaculia bacterium]